MILVTKVLGHRLCPKRLTSSTSNVALCLKHEKASRVKEAYALGGEKVLMKDKLSRLTQD
jgi:hypothetical protein